MAEALVVGAGPVGLTMAAELARNGARCRIVDRLAQPSPFCQAIGVTPRTLEIWDDLGIAREMIVAGIWLDGMRSIISGRPPHDERLDFSDLPYSELGVPQYETERVLIRHLGRYSIAIERGAAFAGPSERPGGVAVLLAGVDGKIKTAEFRYVTFRPDPETAPAARHRPRRTAVRHYDRLAGLPVLRPEPHRNVRCARGPKPPPLCGRNCITQIRGALGRCAFILSWRPSLSPC